MMQILDGINYLVFDLEISDLLKSKCELSRPERLTPACLVCYSSKDDAFFKFSDKNFHDCTKLFLEADLLISFNGLRFDLPILGVSVFSPSEYLRILNKPHIDLCLTLKKTVGHWVSLDSCARGCFGSCKEMDSAVVPRLWRDGHFFAVFSHCQQDVHLTKELFFFILKNGFVKFEDKYTNKCRSVGVDLNVQSKKL